MSDLRIKYNELMTGVNHPSLPDTLSRRCDIQHKDDGSHRDANFHGTTNLSIGHDAGTSRTTGIFNTNVGHFAGNGNTTGHRNTFIGHGAGYNNIVGSSNVFIGYNAGYNETGAKKLYISDSITPRPLIYGDFENKNLSFCGVGTRYGVASGGFAIPLVTSAPVGNVNGGAYIYFDGTSMYHKYKSTTTVLGAGALGTSTTTYGTANTLLGYLAGADRTTGIFNTMVGRLAGKSLTTGKENTFIGDNAGYSNTNGSCNVFIGQKAGYMETGNHKLYIAGFSGTTLIISTKPLIYGEFNNKNISFCNMGTRLGAVSGGVGIPLVTTAPVGNVAGGAVLYFDGTSIKYKYKTITSSLTENIGTSANVYGTANTLLGYLAGADRTTGIFNTMVGRLAGKSLTTGKENTFIGDNAGYTNTVGSSNVLVGQGAGYTQGTVSGNTFIGFNAGYNNVGSPNTFIGFEAGRKNGNCHSNTYIGFQAGYEQTTGGTCNVVMGHQAGYSGVNLISSVAIGYKAGYAATGRSCTYIGARAGYNNVAYGGNPPVDNTYIGAGAGEFSLGNTNIFIGKNAGRVGTYGRNSQNVFIGVGAGINTKGMRNTYIGNDVVASLSAGDDNVFMGFQAGYSNTVGAGGTSSKNVGIGVYAGYRNTTGGENINIGYQAGYNNTVGSCNVFIGQNAGYMEKLLGNHKLYISNKSGTTLAISATPLIYGEFNNKNISFCNMGTRLGAGVGVVGIPLVTTAPAGNVGGGATLYFDGTTIIYKYKTVVRSISFT